MDEWGYVNRSVVIDVLRRNGVDVSRDESGPAGMVILAKGDHIESRSIPAEVSRRMLHYFQRRFGVPIHHFYNPLMAPKLPGESMQ